MTETGPGDVRLAEHPVMKRLLIDIGIGFCVVVLWGITVAVMPWPTSSMQYRDEAEMGRLGNLGFLFSAIPVFLITVVFALAVGFEVVARGASGCRLGRRVRGLRSDHGDRESNLLRLRLLRVRAGGGDSIGPDRGRVDPATSRDDSRSGRVRQGGAAALKRASTSHFSGIGMGGTPCRRRAPRPGRARPGVLGVGGRGARRLIPLDGRVAE